MKTKIVILCADAALAGCSRQGGTGADQYRSTGSTTGSTYETGTITNRDTNQPNTNRFGTQGGTGAGSSSDQTQPKSSQGTGTSPQGSGTQQ